MNTNKIKNEKKFPDLSGISGQKGQNAVFCHFDVRRARRLAFANLMISRLLMFKSDFSQAQNDIDCWYQIKSATGNGFRQILAQQLMNTKEN